jgi:hypothetical protein
MPHSNVQPNADHSRCSYSGGIHDGPTAGRGKLDQWGYWEHPCPTCARALEQRSPELGPVWPFASREIADQVLGTKAKD